MTDDIKKLAIGFEAVRVAAHQTKDGWKITLVIHPNDMSAELASHPVGTRYQVALVEISDEGEPVNQRKTETDQAVAAAGMLTRNPRFQAWCVEQRLAADIGEDAAKNAIYYYCGIESRKQLATNKEALDKFNELRLRFSKAL